MIAATKPEGAAENVGRHLAGMALQMRDQAGAELFDFRRRADRDSSLTNIAAAKAAAINSLRWPLSRHLGDCERICAAIGRHRR